MSVDLWGKDESLRQENGESCQSMLPPLVMEGVKSNSLPKLSLFLEILSSMSRVVQIVVRELPLPPWDCRGWRLLNSFRATSFPLFAQSLRAGSMK